MIYDPIEQLNREEEQRQREPHYLFLAFTVLILPLIALLVYFGEWIDTAVTVFMMRIGREGQIALGWGIVVLVLVLVVRREIKRS